ncbi:MAG: hypothetical protein V3U02_04530 [Calditrichia bacterium]
MADKVTINFRTLINDINDRQVLDKKLVAGRESVTEVNYQRFSLPDSVSDQAVDFANVDASNLFVLKSSKVITVKVGGTEADRAVTVSPTLTDDEDSSSDYGIYIFSGTATAIYLSNASGLASDIEIILL